MINPAPLEKQNIFCGALFVAFVYAMAVFVFGFLLGSLRMILMILGLSELIAVLIELPVMLFISWRLCKSLIHQQDVFLSKGWRLFLGVCALLFLLTAEFLLAHFAFGASFVDHLQAYQKRPAELGLIAQIVFGLFPLIQLIFSAPSSNNSHQDHAHSKKTHF